MSYTKSTATLGLPQWVDNDFPSWLTDVNGAFKSIDDNAGTLTAGVEGVTATASNALNLATESSNKVATLSGEVESVKETATTAAETADAASTTASAAKSAADEASTTASAAKSAADAASSTASEAKSTADAASSTASEAKSAAESASSTASAAKSAADTAAADAASAMSASSNIYTDATGFYHTVSGTNGGHVTFDSGNVDVKADDNMTGLTVDSAGMLDVYDTSGVSLFNSTNVLSRIAALEVSSGGRLESGIFTLNLRTKYSTSSSSFKIFQLEGFYIKINKLLVGNFKTQFSVFGGGDYYAIKGDISTTDIELGVSEANIIIESTNRGSDVIGSRLVTFAVDGVNWTTSETINLGTYEGVGICKYFYAVKK